MLMKKTLLKGPFVESFLYIWLKTFL